MDENAALETVAALLDSLEAWRGEGRTADWLDVSPHDLAAAFKTLSQQSSNGMLAEVLVEKSVAAFAPHLRQFQDVLCAEHDDSEVQAALLRLRDHYDVFSPLVTDWCTQLGMPSVARMFPVHIRCRLLQADLLTGCEPRGKASFIAFLRHHCRERLRDPSGGATHARSSLGGGTTTDTATDEANTVSLFGHLARKSLIQRDAVFSALHRLTLSEVAELKHLWHDLLEEAMVDRVNEAVADEMYGEYKLTALLQWEETAITSFVHMALPSADLAPGLAALPIASSTGVALGGFDAFARSEKERWCGEMRQKLLRCYARCRMAPLWDILAEYPDSIPALIDVRYCLEASQGDTLKQELVTSLKRLLAARLHRAGTRTEDILAMLIKTIHSLGVLLSRNDQNTVIFAVVGDTLAHLHKRKDSVAAIVQVITRWTGDSDGGPAEVRLAESGLPATTATAAPLGGAHAAPSVAIAAFSSSSSRVRAGEEAGAGRAVTGLGGAAPGEEDLDDTGGDIAGSLRSSARGRPDILRVLLSAIPLRSLVQEYQRVLAQQLLSKAMANFDTTPEEEVLERLKCTFGEEPLSQCVVMVRDIQMSRRLTQQLRGMRGLAPAVPLPPPPPPPLTAPEELSVDVLSLTAWPPLPRASASLSASEAIASTSSVPSPEVFTPHPALQGEMERVAGLYKELRANRRLVWLLPESRVKLDVVQRDQSKGAGGGVPVPVEFEVSVFVGSLVLFLRELAAGAVAGASESASVPLATLASHVKVTVDQLRPHVLMWSPKLFVLGAAGDTVGLQTSLVHGETLAFDEAEEATTVKEEPLGFAPEQLKLYERLLKTMIKTQGPKSANEVFNSIKIVGGFTGTLADAKRLLQHFVSASVLALNEAKLYTLP